MSGGAGTTSKYTAPTFIERIMSVHTVMKYYENMTGTVVENDSNTTDSKHQPLFKSVVRPPSDMKRKNDRTLADFSVVTKSDIEPIVENCLTK